MAEPAKPKRRMVKKAETIREKAEKLNQAKQPKNNNILSLSLRYIAKPFRLIGRGFSRLGSFLGKYKVFRAIGRIIWPMYFRNSWKEIKQVTWPTGRETRQLVLAVIIFSSVFGILIAVVDYGLNKLFKQLIIG